MNLAQVSDAQQPYYKKYTQEDGLPSTVVYNITQDKNHFMWFSTENGVCRFDGRNIKQFTPGNSKFDLGIFYLYCDSRNRVWAISIFSAPCFYFNNSFYQLPKKMQHHVRNARWMFEDGKGYIYFLTLEGNVVRWLEGDNYTTLKIPDVSLVGGAAINDTTVVISGGPGIWTITNFKDIKPLPLKGYPHETNRLFRVRENLVIGYVSDGIYQHTPSGHKLIRKHADPFSSISYSMHVENDSTIWLATRDGIHIYHYQNDSLHFIRKLFPGKSILAIHRDYNNNYWVGASNEAIYFRNATKNKYYNFGNRTLSIDNIILTGNTIHAFSKNGDHYQLQNDSIKYVGSTIDKAPTFTFLEAIKHSDSSILVTFNAGNIGIIKNGWGIDIKTGGSAIAAANHYYRNDGKLFSAKHSGRSIQISEICGDSIKTVLTLERVYRADVSKQFCFDYKQRCWSSLGDTLICLERNSSNTTKISRYDMKGIFVSDIRCDKANNIWVATKGGGVYCIGNDNAIANYTTDNGLVTNFSTSLYVDDNNEIWVCSQEGLNKIFVDKTGKQNIMSFTKDNLLPSNVVNCVAKKGNWVYTGTAEGLFVFEDANNTSILPINSYITNVLINGRNVQVKDNYTISYGSSINIGFSVIDYNQSTPPVFHYRLDGAEESWNTTTTGQIQYGQLKPGKYTFMVYTGKSPLQSISISIVVLTPFWQKWWFILLIATLLLAGAFAISYVIIRIKNRKAELARRVLENDLKSLRAQINPHFIFNALNSIQDFILDQQPRTANHYLTSFARLMRMIVDNSKKEWISLADEIHFLNLYLELEKLRLGDTFTANIITDGDVNITQIYIPPMLIQPFIENSLKHGLAGKAGEKILEIHFSMKGKMVYCRIKDNGVGRVKAKAIAARSKQSISTGIANISERLQILHATGNTTEYLIITDLYNGPVAAGTLVEIHVPYIIEN
jgi:hypothetical protein